MSLKNAPSEEVNNRRGVHFMYTPTEAGKSWRAYIAGPCLWIRAHGTGKTRPCLDWLTDGALMCDHCQKGQESQLVGYQPLWRETDGRPCCVIVHADQRESVDSFKRPAGIQVCREFGVGNGVYFRKPMSALPVFHAVHPAKLCDADMTDSCLRMWKIPALVSWYLAKPGSKQGGVIHPPKSPAITLPFPVTNPTDPASEEGESLGEQFGHLKTNNAFIRSLKGGVGLDPNAE